MTSDRTLSFPSRVPLTRALAAAVLALAVGASACSREEPASERSTTSSSTTTEPPTTTAAPAEPGEEAPEAAWIVQIGSAGEDELLGVAAREDEVVAVGSTDGDLQGPNAGATDAVVVAVGTDGEVRSVEQHGSVEAEEAAAVGSSAGTTVACGAVDLLAGAGEVEPADTGSEAWCAPIDEQGALGRIEPRGSTEADGMSGVSVAPDGAFGYAAGSTLGLFPDASDTSSGVLGEGDALLWRIDPGGVPTWIRQFGTGRADSASAVTTTSTDDAVVVGVTSGDLRGPGSGAEDGFLARYEASGLPRWSRQFGSEGADRALGVAVGGETARGTEVTVAVGETEGALAAAVGGEPSGADSTPRLDGQEPVPANAGGMDAMIVAFDTSGDELWAAQLGTDGDESAAAAAVDGGTVLVGGSTTGSLGTAGAPAAGGADGFLASVDAATGELRWIVQFGSAGEERVHGLTVTEDGLVVLAGTTTAQMGDEPNAGGTDGFLIAFPIPTAGGSVASSL